MDYGSTGSDSGRNNHPSHCTSQNLTWKDRKAIINKIYEAIDKRNLDQVLSLLETLEDIIQRAVGPDKLNVATPTVDKTAFTDHVRNLYIHTDLLLLNCSVERVRRLRAYVKKYYDELNRKENGIYE